MPGKEKPYLQGWAIVENPTDEDWAGVKMALDQRPADFVQDGFVQPAVRAAADGGTGTVRLAAAADLRGGFKSRSKWRTAVRLARQRGGSRWHPVNLADVPATAGAEGRERMKWAQRTAA